MAQDPLLDNTLEKQLAELQGRLARLEGSSASALPPAKIGSYRFCIDPPSQLTGLVVNQGVEFLMNGATYSAALYPAFDAAWTAAGGASGTLEDIIGRILVCCGSNASTVFGADDGVGTESNRATRHNHSKSLSADTGGSHSHTFTGVTSAALAPGGGGNFVINSQPTQSTSTHAGHTHTISGSVGPGGSLPTDTPAFGAFCWIYIRCL